MNQQNPLMASFPVGTWFLTHVRVSIFFPIVLAIFMYRFGWQVGSAISAILFVSVLIHEFGHVAAARFTGGMGDEILIWPLGGLAFVHPGVGHFARFLTAAAGPLSHLFICGITIWAAIHSPFSGDIFNPFVLPFAEFSSHVMRDVLVLIFKVNLGLLLVNLIPVHPLDGGQMLQTALSARMGNENATGTYLWIGLAVAAAMLIGGMLFDSIWVVFIGAIVLSLNTRESFQMRSNESFDDSFMGYDFSQGYTSLERSQPVVKEKKASFFQTWRTKRREQKRQRKLLQIEEAERQLDILLEKVHNGGMTALSEAEKRQLNRVSNRIREKRNETEST